VLWFQSHLPYSILYPTTNPRFMFFFSFSNLVLHQFGIGMKVYYTRCLIEGQPCLVAFAYGSNNNVVSERLVEKLQLPTTFQLNQAWFKFSTEQCVKEVLCEWAWLCFKTLNLDERSLCLRHEGHKVKLRFMTPRQVSKDQHIRRK